METSTGTSVVSWAGAGLAGLTERGFAVAARARRARVLHPRGVVADGTAYLDGTAAATGARFLDEEESYPVRVRFSKAAGTPGALPDALGLAVRFDGARGPGRPADLLLTTTATVPGLRHLPLPSRGWHACYGTLLPFRTPHGWYVLAARGPQRSVPPSLDALARALATTAATFTLLAAPVPGLGALGATTRRTSAPPPTARPDPLPPLWGDGWRRVGHLEVAGPTRPDDPGLRFDPALEPPGMRFPNPLRRWRAAAYEGSREGFPPHGD